MDDRVSIDRILKIEPVGPPPLVAPAGVVSSAGFKDPAAMGGLATLFGTGLIDQEGIVTAPGFPLPMKLAGLSVWFGTKPAPILGVAKVNEQEQVNVQVPARPTAQSSLNEAVPSGSFSTRVIPHSRRPSSLTRTDAPPSPTPTSASSHPPIRPAPVRPSSFSAPGSAPSIPRSLTAKPRRPRPCRTPGRRP